MRHTHAPSTSSSDVLAVDGPRNSEAARALDITNYWQPHCPHVPCISLTAQFFFPFQLRVCVCLCANVLGQVRENSVRRKHDGGRAFLSCLAMSV